MQQTIANLNAVYSSPNIINQVKDAPQVIGFVCAIASAPEPIELDIWLPQLALDEQALSFSKQQDAVSFANAVLALYQSFCDHYQQQRLLDLDTVLGVSKQSANVQTIQFAVGYLSALQLVQPQWLAILAQAETGAQDYLQSIMLLLGKIARPDNAKAEIQALYQQLPEHAEIVASLPALLSQFGGLAWSYIHRENESKHDAI